MAIRMIESEDPDDATPRLVDDPGERWERQFQIVEMEVSGFGVFEAGTRWMPDQPVACFTDETDAQRFIAAVQFGQRYGHRCEHGIVIEALLPAWSYEVFESALNREEAEREARREKRRAAKARKLAAV